MAPDRRGSRAAAVVVGLLGVLLAGAAEGHPHVFIDYAATLVVVGDRVEGVRLGWTFDDLFSGFILQEFDKDRNGALSPAEVRAVEEKHLGEFKKVGYHTVVSVNDKPVTTGPARDFRATLVKGIVTYEFTLPFAAPLASTTAVEIVIDDPSYFIAYAVTSAGPASQATGPFVIECRTAHDKSGMTPDAARCAIRRR